MRDLEGEMACQCTYLICAECVPNGGHGAAYLHIRQLPHARRGESATCSTSDHLNISCQLQSNSECKVGALATWHSTKASLACGAVRTVIGKRDCDTGRETYADLYGAAWEQGSAECPAPGTACWPGTQHAQREGRRIPAAGMPAKQLPSSSKRTTGQALPAAPLKIGAQLLHAAAKWTALP